MPLRDLAERLNGTVNGRWVNIQGLRHSRNDRSLGVRFDPAAPDGFFVHSFADEQAECRAYVKSLIAKLGAQLYAPYELNDADAERAHAEQVLARISRAMVLWEQAKTGQGNHSRSLFAQPTMQT